MKRFGPGIIGMAPLRGFKYRFGVWDTKKKEFILGGLSQTGAIKATFRPGQCRDKNPSREWVKNAMEARRIIKEMEKQP